MKLIHSLPDLVGKEIVFIDNSSHDVFLGKEVIIGTKCGHLFYGSWEEHYDGDDDLYEGQYQLRSLFTEHKVMQKLEDDKQLAAKLIKAGVLQGAFKDAYEKKRLEAEEYQAGKAKEKRREMYLRLKEEFKSEDI